MADHARIAGIDVDTRHWIGGERIASPARFPVFSPIDGEPLAEVSAGSGQEADAAVRAAGEAFPRWAALGPAGRRPILDRLANGILARIDDLAAVETRDNGSLLIGNRKNVMARCAHNVAFFAELGCRMEGEVIAGDTVDNHVRYEPSGVAALITPWNAPLMLGTWKVGPALAAGNTVVLKPPEWTPLTCSMLADVAAEAGLPAGVLNVLQGAGEEAGAALAAHPDLARISFTGSAPTARRIGRHGVHGRSGAGRADRRRGGRRHGVGELLLRPGSGRPLRRRGPLRHRARGRTLELRLLLRREERGGAQGKLRGSARCGQGDGRAGAWVRSMQPARVRFPDPARPDLRNACKFLRRLVKFERTGTPPPAPHVIGSPRFAGSTLGIHPREPTGDPTTMTLKGWTLPQSPTGKSSLLPPPPWHYSGEIISADFTADPDRVAELLPPGMAPRGDGSGSFVFADWCSATDRDPRIRDDPAMGQYHEAYCVLYGPSKGRR